MPKTKTIGAPQSPNHREQFKKVGIRSSARGLQQRLSFLLILKAGQEGNFLQVSQVLSVLRIKAQNVFVLVYLLKNTS